MKKLLLILITILSLAFVGIAVAHPVYAVDIISPACNATAGNGQKPTYCKDNTAEQNAQSAGVDTVFGKDGVLTKVVQALTIIVGGFAVFVLFIAGIRIVASNGDPNTIATMRQAIIAAIVGLVIAGLAQVIVIFILSKV